MVYIKESVIKEIKTFLGDKPAEQGGIIGSFGGETITHFYWDSDAVCDDNTYIPNTAQLNEIIDSWLQGNIEFKGFVHSHKDREELSPTDIAYACSVARAFKIEYTLMGIVGGEGVFPLRLFKVSCEGNVGAEAYTIMCTPV